MEQHTILHTIETGGPGGAETVLVNLASRTDWHRFRSVALVPSGTWLPQKLRELGVQTCILESRRWYDPRMMVRMAEFIIREKVDLIHSHLPDQNFYSCLAGRLTRRKTIVTYHGSQHLSKSEGFKTTTKLWLVRHSAISCVAVSNYVQELLSSAGFPSDRIARIHNGIDIEQFSPNGPWCDVRARVGCQNGTKLVGMVANIRESKGYEFFIQAAQRLTARMPNVRFAAIGDIDPRIGAKLLNLIRQMGLTDRFFLLGFRQDVDQVLRELDVFILSSISEGFSLVTVEAMATGKPIVVTRSGGPEEIIEDGRTGLLVPPTDPESLAEKIFQILNNPERAARMASRAREKALADFSLGKMISNYEALYERILNPS